MVISFLLFGFFEAFAGQPLVGDDWKGATPKLSAPPEAFHASGYDLTLGLRPSAVLTLPACTKSSLMDACVYSVQDREVTEYTRSVKDRDDHSSLVQSVTEAEGGGFGISMSTAVTAIQTSQTTDASWSYFVGQSSKTERRIIHNPGGMKLGEAAKQLLQTHPMEFLQTYGFHYIFSIDYGGSFLGSFSLTERNTASKSDLEIFAKVDAKTCFFNASASEDFQSKSGDSSSHLKMFANVKYRGGSSIRTDLSSPYALGEMFLEWEQSMTHEPVPIIMTLRSWMDSEEVQEIVNSMPVDVQEAFRMNPISQTTRDILSGENGKIFLLTDSVLQALGWKQTKENTTLRQELRHLQRDIDAHRVALATLGEKGILSLQADMKRGNFSWFIADQLVDEFDAIKAELPAPPKTMMVLQNPGSGKCLDIDSKHQFPDEWLDGTRVQLLHCYGGATQHWEFRNGQIVNPDSGKCLEIDAPTMDPYRDLHSRHRVQIGTCGDVTQFNQQWAFGVKNKIVNPVSGLIWSNAQCLNVPTQDGYKDGSGIQIWECRPSHWLAEEQWRFVNFSSLTTVI